MIADIAAVLDIAVWVVIVSTVVLYSAAAVGASLLLWLAFRAIVRAHQTRWHTGPHDVGPDALRLLEDLDRDLDEMVAADPELAAGFERLREAVADEQQKGETP
ncbi:hypothetical protein ACFWCA_32640 [Streptomyces phaeochromogenes]|uniref:hypothetical protein n=1 Tax=Streptomyces phaeochromogenes TaxID=1923 RepID=UPI00368C598F